jgi:hypothetical protein
MSNRKLQEKIYRYSCHAVMVFREIRHIMKKNKWTEDWGKRYYQFLEENRCKRLLIKELEKF